MDVGHFLNQLKNQTKCWVLEEYLGEVNSELEKELLSRALAFYRSRPSNWSYNVQASRFGRFENLPYDRAIFDIFDEINFLRADDDPRKVYINEKLRRDFMRSHYVNSTICACLMFSYEKEVNGMKRSYLRDRESYLPQRCYDVCGIKQRN